MPPEASSYDSSILGGRTNRTASTDRRLHVDGPPDAFGLFCSYYLGITPDDGYQKPNLDEIARRHRMTPEQIRELLTEYKLEPATVRSSSFDLEGAQLDIRLAPEGISRTEAARDLYAEYLETLGE